MNKESKIAFINKRKLELEKDFEPFEPPIWKKIISKIVNNRELLINIFWGIVGVILVFLFIYYAVRLI